MSWKGFESTQLWSKLRYYPRIYVKILRKTARILSIAGVPGKIRTERLPDTCLERYRYSNPHDRTVSLHPDDHGDRQKESESESESELLYDWRFTANQFVLATSPLRLTTSNFLFRLNTCGRKLLLVLASAVILGSESRGTHDHILLS
jgi:hypothetical protein